MQIVTSKTDLRHCIHTWRSTQQRIAFVPTMGNLHAGHLRLVQRAHEVSDKVIVSIFVNPTQFGADGGDYQTYPRTLEADCNQLKAEQADAVFTPNVSDMYPTNTDSDTRVYVPKLSEILCGASRDGHFAGVTTIVTKLFNLLQPDIALFGEKDYQQLFIIKRMVKDLFMPIEIIGVPTVREKDGLAMSSRNGYLTPEQRQIAPQLYQNLQTIATQLQTGNRDFCSLIQQASQQLTKAGFTPDYIAIRDTQTLLEPETNTNKLVILAAAWLGKARLIDNLVCHL